MFYWHVRNVWIEIIYNNFVVVVAVENGWQVRNLTQVIDIKWIKLMLMPHHIDWINRYILCHVMIVRAANEYIARIQVPKLPKRLWKKSVIINYLRWWWNVVQLLYQQFKLSHVFTQLIWNWHSTFQVKWFHDTKHKSFTRASNTF